MPDRKQPTLPGKQEGADKNRIDPAQAPNASDGAGNRSEREPLGTIEERIRAKRLEKRRNRQTLIVCCIITFIVVIVLPLYAIIRGKDAPAAPLTVLVFLCLFAELAFFVPWARRRFSRRDSSLSSSDDSSGGFGGGSGGGDSPSGEGAGRR